MPPAPLLQPLALPSCSWPCSPPPPQGRWPVCAERGACAPSLPHFPTSPLPHSFLPPSFFLLPLFFGSSAHSEPRSPAFPAVRHSTPPLLHLHFPAPPLMRSSPPPFFLLPPFLRPSAHSSPRFPAFTAMQHSPPLLRSFIPPLFSSSPFLRPSAHSEPRYPAFPAVRHSTHPLLHLHFPAPPPIRVPIPAFPAVRHSHPLLRSFIPPFFLLPLSFAPPPIRVPFSRVPRRATFPSAPLRQVLTGNREKSRQPHRRSSRTKKSGPHGPDSIGYQSVFQKKGEITSRAYECSHPT